MIRSCRAARFAAVLTLTCACGPALAADRAAAVAGQFYPASAERLRAGLEAMLCGARPAAFGRPIAIVVPHAGYVYSGQIAADGFNQARGRRYSVIVILGANHTLAGFGKVGISPASRFLTPLGPAEVDRPLARELLEACSDCVEDARVHAREHSVEVQVPFVQQLFPGIRILPIVVGSAEIGLVRRFGSALARVLVGRDALIVASSDLSHYPRAADAERADARTLEVLARLDPEALQASLRFTAGSGPPGLETGACGEAPVLAAQVASRALGASRGAVVSYAHSGQTLIGDEARVVGYGAAVFVADEGPLRGERRTPGLERQPAAEGLPGPQGLERPQPSRGAPGPGADLDRRLLAFAREAIARLLETETLPLPRGFPAEIEKSREGAFVTLKKQGQLRGCIGQVVPEVPLPRLVGAMALQAAFHDPRFPPLREEELRAVELELSLLTPPRHIARAEEVEPGRHGVVLEKAGRTAVFLPQVAKEQGWDRATLLDNLCRKGSLPAGCWREGAALSVFEARVVSERR